MAGMMKKKGYRMGGMMKKKGMKNGGKVNNLKKAIKKVNAKKKATKNGKKTTMAQRMKALRGRKKK